jgi:hypothetical protein
MRPEAAIRVSRPKKATRIGTDIAEDVARPGAPMGLVDVNVCAVDDAWSGLEPVLREERRTADAARGKARR